MAIQLNNVVLIVNNEQQAYAADSLSFHDGKGEFNQRSAPAGGDQVEIIYSEDLSTKRAMVKFELPSTAENIQSVRQWKNNRNANVVTLQATTIEGDNFSRVFSGAAILGNPEYSLATDGNVEVEFNSNPAI